jgi:hypothetical protein
MLIHTDLAEAIRIEESQMLSYPFLNDFYAYTIGWSDSNKI